MVKTFMQIAELPGAGKIRAYWRRAHLGGIINHRGRLDRRHSGRDYAPLFQKVWWNSLRFR